MRKVAIVKGDGSDVMLEVLAGFVVDALARGVDSGVCIAENTGDALKYLESSGVLVYRGERSAEARLVALRNPGVNVVVTRVDEQKIRWVEDLRAVVQDRPRPDVREYPRGADRVVRGLLGI